MLNQSTAQLLDKKLFCHKFITAFCSTQFLLQS